MLELHWELILYNALTLNFIYLQPQAIYIYRLLTSKHKKMFPKNHRNLLWKNKIIPSLLSPFVPYRSSCGCLLIRTFRLFSAFIEVFVKWCNDEVETPQLYVSYQ